VSGLDFFIVPPQSFASLVWSVIHRLVFPSRVRAESGPDRFVSKVDAGRLSLIGSL
jgi:hypothetical protein